VTPLLIVREPALPIVRFSPFEISTSVDIVTNVVTVQVWVALSHESPEPVHHVPRSVAAYTLGTAPSRETMLRDSRASNTAAPK
jgi:hypothetical protein